MALCISKSSLAVTIIKLKSVLFNKEYITTSELDYIHINLQRKFNKEKVNIIINNDNLDNNIEKNGQIIKLSSNSSNNFIMLSVLGLTEYSEIIIDLIVEYAEFELQQQVEIVSQFKSDKRDIKEKQKKLLEYSLQKRAWLKKELQKK